VKARHPKSPSSRSWTDQRRGAILVWFAIFLFVLLPLMTLIMHLGMTTLTRRQMQTAVNSAAIEGLRFRDDSSLTEAERREKVHDLVAVIFDDNFGAGPDNPFVDDPDGIPLPGTEFVASRRIAPARIRGFNPDDLQINENNEVYGDMLSGDYHGSADHQEGVDPFITLEEQYQRADFTIDSDTTDDDHGDAFLVRMRRSGETFDKPATGSSGPPIPFLFGRGPYGDEDFPTSGSTDLLDYRERGTIVRATAIAQAKPVITVGVPSEDMDYGLAQFEIQFSSWPESMDPLPLNEIVQLVDGDITGAVTGRFIDRELTVIGDPITPLNLTPPNTELELGEHRVVPITSLISGQTRVIGFGVAILDFDDDMGEYTITIRASEIIARNASSNFAKSLEITGADFDDVWDAFNDLNHRALAPALVRALD